MFDLRSVFFDEKLWANVVPYIAKKPPLPTAPNDRLLAWRPVFLFTLGDGKQTVWHLRNGAKTWTQAPVDFSAAS